jgi:hypothetical protein
MLEPPALFALLGSNTIVASEHSRKNSAQNLIAFDSETAFDNVIALCNVITPNNTASSGILGCLGRWYLWQISVVCVVKIDTQ